MNKIMVVDDAAFMRMMLKDILSEAGYKHIIEAKSGNEALTFHRVEQPKVVILDVTMPDVDGLEVLKKIKATNPSTKVIMCSSMGLEDMVTECFGNGADDFILKPFKPERIIQAVSEYVSPKDVDE